MVSKPLLFDAVIKVAFGVCHVQNQDKMPLILAPVSSAPINELVAT